VYAVLPKARQVLFGIPGVHAVGVGTKIIGGQFTQEPVVMVFVERKKPLAELPPEEVIPSEIDGVKTDVYQAGKARIMVDVDNDRYRILRAGVQIEPGGVEPSIVRRRDPAPPIITPGSGLGGLGTVGFFVNVGGATPRTYAVTNQHVMASEQRGQKTNLTSHPQGLTVTFGTNDNSATVTPGTLVVQLYVADGTFHGYYLTRANDTPQRVAEGLAAHINAAGHHVVATVAGNTLTLGPQGVVHAIVDPHRFGPFPPNTWSNLKSVVDEFTITFSGKAKSSCGAFVNWNAGLAAATDGIFVPIEPRDTPEQIAGNVAQAITDLHIVNDLPAEVPVTAKPTGATVTFGGVQHVECHVTSDAQVGQPDSQFCSSRCSRCCDHRIGLVAYARLNVDAAMIQLDPGRKYRTDIEDVGAIAGVHDVKNAAGGVPLWKRGRTTRVTTGRLIAHTVAGGFATQQDTEHGQQPEWTIAHRFYTNAFSFGDVPPGPDPFLIEGDSGAAVVTPTVVGPDGARTTTIAGLMFGGDGAHTAYAMHIDDVFTALNAQLVAPAVLDTATKEGVDKQAPPLPPSGTAHTLAIVTHRDLTPEGEEDERLAQVDRELRATPGGQFYGALIMRHLSEAMTLIDTNKRMATVWHRNGGPGIADGLLRMLRIPGQRIPPTINGMPLADCLQQIGSAFARYGSLALAADIAAHGPEIIRLAGVTYPELLAEFGTPVETT
jgi:hypothetical protein